ncbi:protease modulator HflK [Novosphingobium sp.]|uniref:protease modulator HflK n=1 Tax=Novosphingobium sp. TaxID=1874826 RepID=UPI003B515AA0
MNGFDPAPAARDAEPPVVDADDTAPDAPGTAAPVPGPWHQSRAGRGARRGPKRDAARVSGVKGLLATIAAGNPARHLGGVRVPRLYPGFSRSWLPWIAGAVVAGWLGATSLHPVGPHEQAIVVTAGAWGPVQGPGLAVSWPWPVGSVVVADVTSVRHLVLPEGEAEHLMLTRDGALIDVGYDVRWRIGNLRDHALGAAEPDGLLRLAAENAMRGAVARVDFGAGLGSGRDALGHDAAQRLQVLLDRDRAGILVTGIDIRRADPPARVAEALRAITSARSDAQTEATQAQSWGHQLIATAQGEAGAFDKVYEQYRHAPDVIHRQMYYATMERVLAQSDKVIVDAPGATIALPAQTVPAPAPPVVPPRPDTGPANGH